MLFSTHGFIDFIDFIGFIFIERLPVNTETRVLFSIRDKLESLKLELIPTQQQHLWVIVENVKYNSICAVVVVWPTPVQKGRLT